MAGEGRQPGEQFANHVKRTMTPRNFVGCGEEKTVYLDHRPVVSGSNPEEKAPAKVVGVFRDEWRQNHRESDYSLKARYYLSNLLNIFIPDNYPRINLVTTVPDSISRDYIYSNRFASSEKVDSITKEIKDRFGVGEVGYYENYLENSSGNPVHVDTLVPWFWQNDGLVRNYHPELIKGEIDKIADPGARRTAENYLYRLEEQYKQEMEQGNA